MNTEKSIMKSGTLIMLDRNTETSFFPYPSTIFVVLVLIRLERLR